MKNATTFLFFSLLVISFLSLIYSCENTPIDKSPEYLLTTTTIIPDSLKEKQRQWIKETVSATNLKMTAGDYEDPEDVIETATELSVDLFGVKVYTLNKKKYHEDSYSTVDYNLLSPKEKVILQNLINE